jgi:hypothetical protein
MGKVEAAICKIDTDPEWPGIAKYEPMNVCEG